MRSCGAQINANEGSSGDGVRGCASRQRLPPTGRRPGPAWPRVWGAGGPCLPCGPRPQESMGGWHRLEEGDRVPTAACGGNAQLWEWGVQQRVQCGEARAPPFAASCSPHPLQGRATLLPLAPCSSPGLGQGKATSGGALGGGRRRGERAWRREGPTGLHHSCLSVQPLGLPPSREPPRASLDCPGGREERGPLGWLVFFSFSVFW